MVVCGARGCGKTSVLEKLIYGNNGVRNFLFVFFINDCVLLEISSPSLQPLRMSMLQT